MKLSDCAHCNSGWDIDLDSDRYCGWCGAAINDFSIEVQEEQELFYLQNEEIIINLEIHNKGVKEINIDNIYIEEA